jgi:hypothetical protein
VRRWGMERGSGSDSNRRGCCSCPAVQPRQRHTRFRCRMLVHQPLPFSNVSQAHSRHICPPPGARSPKHSL